MAKMKTPVLLIIQQEGEEQRIEEFNDNIIKIGKLSSVNLKLTDPHINRIHAVIEITGEDTAQIIDMGSSKGTHVNGKRIHKAKITSGDQILLGSTNITIYIGEKAIADAKSLPMTPEEEDAAPASTTVAPAPPNANPDPLSSIAANLGGTDDLMADLNESTRITENPLNVLLANGSASSSPAPNPNDAIETAQVSQEASQAVQDAVAQQQAYEQQQAQQQAYEQQQAQQQAYEQQQAQQQAYEQQQAQQQAYEQQQAQQQAYEQQQAQQQAYEQQQPQQQAYEQQQAQQQAYEQQQPQQQAYEQQQPQQQAYEQQQPQQQAYEQQQPQQQAYEQQQAMYAQQAYGQPQMPQNTGGFAPIQQGYGAAGGLQYQQPTATPQANAFAAPVAAQPATPQMAPAQQVMPQTSAPAAYQQPAPMNFDMVDYKDSQEVLEIKIVWRNKILEFNHFYNPTTITIGDSKSTFQIAPEGLPPDVTSYPLVVAEKDRLLINFTDAMGGSVQIKDQFFTLDQIKQSSKVQRNQYGYQFPLPAQSRVELQMGEFLIHISFVPAPKRLSTAAFHQMDQNLARSMGASFLIHGLILLLMLFSDEEPKTLDIDYLKQGNRFAQLIIRPDEPEKKKKKKKDDGGGAKAKGKEGKMGRKKAPKANRRAGQIKRNEDGTAPIDMQKVEKALRDTLGKKGMLGLLGGAGGGNSAYGAILTAKGIGGDDANGIGGWNGAKVGDAGGAGGLGLRGGGGGGNGFSGTSVGLGKLGTYGAGGGRGGRGWGRGALRRKHKRSVKISAGRPVVFGALDKEIIRRVINQHRAQIKYCYERELIKHPKLQGKIKVFFVISASGRVSEARVTQSTMNNDRVEQCIVRRVRFWRFPAPKGGGIVHVNYPFFFKPS